MLYVGSFSPRPLALVTPSISAVINKKVSVRVGCVDFYYLTAGSRFRLGVSAGCCAQSQVTKTYHTPHVLVNSVMEKWRACIRCVLLSRLSIASLLRAITFILRFIRIITLHTKTRFSTLPLYPSLEHTSRPQVSLHFPRLSPSLPSLTLCLTFPMVVEMFKLVHQIKSKSTPMQIQTKPLPLRRTQRTKVGRASIAGALEHRRLM